MANPPLFLVSLMRALLMHALPGFGMGRRCHGTGFIVPLLNHVSN